MRTLKRLFDNNRQWTEARRAEDPEFFANLAQGQAPEYLWIGCSDSRVVANELLGLGAGELFVHRNIANLVLHTDFNCLSVIEFAINQLGIRKVIVCGHYGCSGIAAAMKPAQLGLADNWLRHVRDVRALHRRALEAIADDAERCHHLVELNVIHQVFSLCHTTIAQNAWARGVDLEVHGWVYSLETGLLKDLNCCVSSPDQIQSLYQVVGQDG
jgi:carbonic anhydrase